MNLNLKAVYEISMDMASQYTTFSIDMLKELSSIVMRRKKGVVLKIPKYDDRNVAKK